MSLNKPEPQAASVSTQTRFLGSSAWVLKIAAQYKMQVTSTRLLFCENALVACQDVVVCFCVKWILVPKIIM